MNQTQATLADLVRDACLAEVSFAKPGNVGPQAGFADADVHDFRQSASAIAPVLSKAPDQPVGQTILEAVEATQAAVGHNTNLGIILLLTPLTAVPCESSIRSGIGCVLESLTVEDAVLAYRAIARSHAAGLGKADQQDVQNLPTTDFRECMKLAADRDLIARQYASNFREVLTFGVPLLLQTCNWQRYQECRLGWLALQFLSQFPDSLILRKNGEACAEQVRAEAADVLRAGWPFRQGSQSAYEQFDSRLRSPNHKLNPGTTADLIAATLFVAMRDFGCRFDDETQTLNIPDETYD